MSASSPTRLDVLADGEHAILATPTRYVRKLDDLLAVEAEVLEAALLDDLTLDLRRAPTCLRFDDAVGASSQLSLQHSCGADSAQAEESGCDAQAQHLRR